MLNYNCFPTKFKGKVTVKSKGCLTIMLYYLDINL